MQYMLNYVAVTQTTFLHNVLGVVYNKRLSNAMQLMTLTNMPPRYKYLPCLAKITNVPVSAVIIIAGLMLTMWTTERLTRAKTKSVQHSQASVIVLAIIIIEMQTKDAIAASIPRSM